MLVPTLKVSLELQFVESDPEPVKAKLTAPIEKQIVPVGEAFEAHTRRVLLGKSFEEDDQEQAELAALLADAHINEADEDAVEIEPESKALLKLDPRDWKSQDHYAVLGLSHLRYKATFGQINFAHRKKVLKHHPDKKANQGGGSNDDAFFKCISKAYDQLSDPVKRRIFDSVDDEVPQDGPGEKVTPDKFIEVWTPIFERESRFSKKESVPMLGGENATKAEVEQFYDFWYNFDSWRSFEYLDKDINDGGDSRDDKRYAERKNKAERARRKKEDTARLRTLVDQALNSDPRIRRFKQEEKAAREAKRKGGKPGNAQQSNSLADAKKKEAEAQAAKEAQAKQDAEQKVQREAAKKSKEAAKKNLKREKKAIRTAVTGANYFVPAGQSPTPSHIEGQLTELDSVLDAMEPEDVAAARSQVDKASGDATAIKTSIISMANKVAIAKGLQLKFLVA